MTFQYVKAKRENVDLMFSLAGPSQSGKTYSAMLLAQALAGDKPFIVADTEGKRSLHYADDFNFERTPISPPYHPEKYTAFIKTAVKRGFPCALIDSMSHEWAGEGGVLDMAQKSNATPPVNWIKPKAEHKKMMNAFISAGIHLVFCLRADEKIEVIDDPKRPGKKAIKSLGFSPIAEKGFLYEMTISLTLHPSNPGIIDLSLPHKLQDRFKPIFMPGTHITPEMGEALAEWARGGKIESPNIEIWRKARQAASKGTVALRDFVETEITTEERTHLRPIGAELNKTAREADNIFVSTTNTQPNEETPKDNNEEHDASIPERLI